jgi:deazaflavin-dependent oxidoreductase (nitroreductase family)
MRLADQRARFNRRVVNKLVRPLAGRVALWSLVEHTGRRSGKTYRTPVAMFATPTGVAILLPYGPDRDWVRNLTAAGGGQVVMSGQTFSVREPRIVPTAEALALLSAPWHRLAGLARVPSTLLLSRGGDDFRPSAGS